MIDLFFFSSRRRHTRCALVTGVQTCALPIFSKKSYRSLKPAPSGWAFRCRVSAKMLAFIRRPSADGRRLKEIPIQWARQSHLCRSWSLFSLALNAARERRSEEHTSELQSLMRISYAVFCLKKTTDTLQTNSLHQTTP